MAFDMSLHRRTLRNRTGWQNGVYRRLSGAIRRTQAQCQPELPVFCFSTVQRPTQQRRSRRAELFLGRPIRTHLDRLRPDMAFEMQTRQRIQKWYRDRGSQSRQVEVGDAVWVTALTRLQEAAGSSWLPGVVLEVVGVKVTVLLNCGKVVQRHLDHVRRDSARGHRRVSSDEVSLADPVPVVVPPASTAPAAAAAATSPPAAAAPVPPVAERGPTGHYDLRPRPTPTLDWL